MPAEGADTASKVPMALAPSEGEAAVCSILVARTGPKWQLICGSLLTVSASVAHTSWRRWAEIQPPRSRPARPPEGLDLGPNFDAEPFAGVRAVRTVLDADAWGTAVESLDAGELHLPRLVSDAQCKSWSPMVMLPQGHIGDAHRVVAGAERPVRGVVAELQPVELAPSESMWQLAAPTYLKPGPALGRMSKERRLLFWPRELLGIDWLGDNDHAPPPRLVVGRTENDAWIVDVWPDYDAGELSISVAWDETRIDPLGCSLLLRVERDGLLLLSQQVRISDLPTRSDAGVEPRTVGWQERALTIGLPRGPSRAEWGLGLLAPDGRVLDERPLARRFEQVSIEFGVAGSTGPRSRSVAGDRKPPPTASESDEAVALAIELAAEARRAAAERRLSTVGDLAEYLRWRFSCRAGELLILDPFLLSGDPAQELSFLGGLDRPIRALTGSVPAAARSALAALLQIDARRLPGGRPSLHDRIWIIGETGLLIGGSVSTFLPSDTGKAPRATTATELPSGDVGVWRTVFDRWWTPAEP
jgi:hypothetical protein